MLNIQADFSNVGWLDAYEEGCDTENKKPAVTQAFCGSSRNAPEAFDAESSEWLESLAVTGFAKIRNRRWAHIWEHQMKVSPSPPLHTIQPTLGRAATIASWPGGHPSSLRIAGSRPVGIAQAPMMSSRLLQTSKDGALADGLGI